MPIRSARASEYETAVSVTPSANWRCKLVLLLLTLLLAQVGCQSASAGNETDLIIFAAASLSEAFGEIARQFEGTLPGVNLVLNFAGSQQLAHQLSQGAPADVFASADEEQMKAVIAYGRVIRGQPQTFATNKLVVAYPADNRAQLQQLSDLTRPGLRLVLATPEVPAGGYALAFLDSAADNTAHGPTFRNGVLANVVSYEESVRAVLSKVLLGEADAGIVYWSDVYNEGTKDIDWLTIPDELNVVATYPIAPVADSARPELARSFVDFVLSPTGQAILAEYGFSSDAAAGIGESG